MVYIGKHIIGSYAESVFDGIHAEILDEHNAEKAKVRNRRRTDRKYPENKHERMRKMRNRLERKYGYYSCDGGIVYRGYINGEIYAEGKIRCGEMIAREDWEVEQDNIYAEDYDAECLRKRVEEAMVKREKVVAAAYAKAERIIAEIAELQDMETPTDWRSWYEFINAVEFMYDGI